MGGSSTGQIVGGTVGAIIGTVIAPGVGTFYGASIGFSLGGLIDPPDVKTSGPDGPAVQDIQGPTFQRNVPVAIVYGYCSCPGNYIFIGRATSRLVKVGESEQASGGKGGSESVDEFERWYDIDFAIAWCEGPIQEYVELFKNQVDVTEEEGNLFTHYQGTLTQEVDQRVVDAILRDGDVPWRGTAYTMWHGSVGPANQIPHLEVRLVGLDTVVEETADYDFVI